MITVLSGENNFEIERAIAGLITSFKGVPEKIDGQMVELRQLPDLLMGGTLFATSRLVIIRSLGENKAAWEALPTWLSRISDDIHLVLIEAKLDKRTKTYKQLQKIADIQEYRPLGDRDIAAAEKWLMTEAKTLGVTLNNKNAQLIVRRVGVDNWALYRALEKLAALDEVTSEAIEYYIDSSPTESVFDLFEAALDGNIERVTRMLAVLRLQEDAYRLFGLLSGQVFQLSALVLSDKPSQEVAKDLAVHPFAIGKMASYAKRLGRGGVRSIVESFAEADQTMKTSAHDPWLLIERALIKTATK